MDQYIDYLKSTIIKMDIGRRDLGILDIKSADGLKVAIEFITPPESVWTKNLILKDKIKDDIFLDRVFGSNYYVSKRLKDEIESAGVPVLRLLNMIKDILN